ncbi:hypothetical protein VNI00_004412 [Paramarasmius palmivorus]|uniref:Uncharacterized protein n=1 Tax=Paramarasmius palmivorus TaxID=297713 RepID=A0AAW0DKF7_9AGAR
MNISALLNADVQNTGLTQGSSSNPPNSSPDNTYVPDMSLPYLVKRNIVLNSSTTLASLSYYAQGAYVPYLSTSYDRTQPEGHLFEVDSDNWQNPINDQMYSHHEPKGGKPLVFADVLRDSEGNKVPCSRAFTTCQGMKICPYTVRDIVTQPHVQVDSNACQMYASAERQIAQSTSYRDVLEATLSAWACLRDKGCLGPLQQETTYTAAEAEARTELLATPQKAKRGQKGKKTCEGRLKLFQVNNDYVVQCEHYHYRNSRDHTCRSLPRSKYELDYFAALFYDTKSVIAHYENAMEQEGFGPLAPCTTVRNFTRQSNKCPNHHRQADGKFYMTLLDQLPCESTFEVYQPHAEYRRKCPKILVICRGPHSHPIPISCKTPTSVRSRLIAFFKTLDDLPNLTARRLIRSDSAKVFLQKELPLLNHPTFIDLHCSLNNRDHLQAIINYAQNTVYPQGTAWQGLLYLKAVEDRTLPPEKRYIRFAEEIRLSDSDSDSELSGEPFRLIICMKPENSLRLVRDGRHVQSDIAFKRIPGWLEFELGGRERTTHSGVSYLRAFLTRQTAEAHRVLLLKVHDIVLSDTGQPLRFRHLHSDSIDDLDFEGIQTWTVDQHGGQAKGIGEYLQHIAPPHRHDLHQPTKLLTELGPYDHLKRLIRVCVAHFYRNIQETHCAPDVQTAMKSLACFEHADWEGALTYIRTKGDRKAIDWLNDKTRSQFAFPGICWQKSFIPARMWQAVDGTSNIIEALHKDLLIEGAQCSLVGGIIKAAHYDHVQLQTHQTSIHQSIPVRYKTRDVSFPNASSRRYDAQDKLIEDQNASLEQACQAYQKAKDGFQNLLSRNAEAEQMTKAQKKLTKAQAKYKKEFATSERMQDAVLGSGRVSIALYGINS